MAFRCLECASDLRNKVMVTRLGDIDVWFCDGCNVYYDKKELKGLIFSRRTGACENILEATILI